MDALHLRLGLPRSSSSGREGLGHCSSARPSGAAAQLSTAAPVLVVRSVVVEMTVATAEATRATGTSAAQRTSRRQPVLRSVGDVAAEPWRWTTRVASEEDSPELRGVLSLRQHQSLRQEDPCGPWPLPGTPRSSTGSFGGAADTGPL
ncbi:unnamed protein product [Prorocentrum cordatum]|uniref:Uncharacterized protein n=1 Tax=Prorocentrum cordatum TaxID=2364126 RepID=A0ABN9QNU7_9DINO|nr:unnamed protein product [Polarella glacialis]